MKQNIRNFIIIIMKNADFNYTIEKINMNYSSYLFFLNFFYKGKGKFLSKKILRE